MEILIVIVILGILATVVVVAVRGSTDRAQAAGCTEERRALLSSAEAYMTQARRSDIPPTGSGPERFEQTLVDAGFFLRPSTMFDVGADGSVTPSADGPC